jgi:DNA-binding NarL/FixJ family response regulator
LPSAARRGPIGPGWEAEGSSLVEAREEAAGMTDTRRNTTLTLLVAEADAQLRERLVQRLGAEDDLEVVAAVGPYPEVLPAVTRLHPWLLLMDLQLPSRAGLQLLETLATLPEAPRVLVMSDDDSEPAQLELAQRGARGFLPRSEAVGSLPDAIRAVARGELWFSRSLKERIFDEYQRLKRRAKAEPRFVHLLTLRERDVLVLIARGMTNHQIARDLQMSIHTVKHHVANLLRKLNVPSRTEAAVVAIREGLLETENGRRSPRAD